MSWFWRGPSISSGWCKLVPLPVVGAGDGYFLLLVGGELIRLPAVIADGEDILLAAEAGNGDVLPSVGAGDRNILPAALADGGVVLL